MPTIEAGPDGTMQRRVSDSEGSFAHRKKHVRTPQLKKDQMRSKHVDKRLNEKPVHKP